MNNSKNNMRCKLCGDPAETFSQDGPYCWPCWTQWQDGAGTKTQRDIHEEAMIRKEKNKNEESSKLAVSFFRSWMPTWKCARRIIPTVDRNGKKYDIIIEALVILEAIKKEIRRQLL